MTNKELTKIIVLSSILMLYSLHLGASEVTPSVSPNTSREFDRANAESDKKEPSKSSEVNATYIARIFDRKITLSETSDIHLVLKNIRRDEFIFNWDFAKSGTKSLGSQPIKKIGINIAKQDKDTSVSLLTQTQYLMKFFPNSAFAKGLSEAYANFAYTNVNTPLYYKKAGVETQLNNVSGTELKAALLWESSQVVGKTNSNIRAFSGVEYSTSTLPKFYTVQRSSSTSSSSSFGAYYLEKPTAQTLAFLAIGEVLPAQGIGLVTAFEIAFGLRNVNGSAIDLSRANSNPEQVNKTAFLVRYGLGLGIGGNYKWGKWSVAGFYEGESFGQEMSSSGNSSTTTSETIQGLSADTGVRAMLNVIF
jgi:hypothetical protein